MKSNGQARVIAGIDDATKCPCIGSIFLAGVAADRKALKRWKALGVKDSKLLSRKRREALGLEIVESALAFMVREITPQMIDDKSINLNQWEMRVVLQIIRTLSAVEGLGRIYIDNWEVSEAHFFRRLRETDGGEEDPASILLIPEHHADENHIIVGAASILAKNGSDCQYDRYREIYGDFGSGSPGDPATRRFVWTHRKNPPPIVRRSWKTYKDLSCIEDLGQDVFSPRRRKAPGRSGILSPADP